MTNGPARATAAGGLLALLVAIGGCGSATAPVDTSPELIVTLSGLSPLQGYDTTISGQPAYVCHFRAEADATGGSPGEVATWGAAYYEYTLTSDGQTNSHTLPYADAFFSNTPTIPAGGNQTSAVTAWYTGPFSIHIGLDYSVPQAATDSATYTFRCL